MRILLLTPGAYGSGGGIAQYNRDLVEALLAASEVARVTAVPRLAAAKPGVMPDRLDYRMPRSAGKSAYFRTLLALLSEEPRHDLVLCGHINLLPAAFLAAWRWRAPLWLQIYGVEAWQPHASPLVRALVRRCAQVATISGFTARRFQGWSGVGDDRVLWWPNKVDLSRFRPGARDATLASRWNVTGGPVLLTLARMDASQRTKGFDAVLETLPELKTRYPGVLYLAAGDGDDRARLREKARALGVEAQTRFPGFINEADKAALYRLADLFVLPSHGEGFGFVLIEALACGVPVIGSGIDGSRDALLGGTLGILVDPRDRGALLAAIEQGLRRPRGVVPPELAVYSRESFQDRVARALTQTRR